MIIIRNSKKQKLNKNCISLFSASTPGHTSYHGQNWPKCTMIWKTDLDSGEKVDSKHTSTKSVILIWNIHKSQKSGGFWQTLKWRFCWAPYFPILTISSRYLETQKISREMIFLFFLSEAKSSLAATVGSKLSFSADDIKNIADAIHFLRAFFGREALFPNISFFVTRWAPLLHSETALS